jgi:hypothetical protein
MAHLSEVVKTLGAENAQVDNECLKQNVQHVQTLQQGGSPLYESDQTQVSSSWLSFDDAMAIGLLRLIAKSNTKSCIKANPPRSDVRSRPTA